ncbi:hypothetical protein [Streptomyces rubrogriseus]|uniref:hypothetical protein n=1 Tax=Streptomyces rubrogriseus TaxID=194673 RepID=UPI0037D25FD4
MDPELLERITARCAELDELEAQLAEVRAEWDELAVAERAQVASMLRQVGGGR